MIPGSALRVIHVLLSCEKSVSLRELSQESGVALSRCSRYVNELERLGYVRKRPKMKVVNEELVYLLAYGRPLKSLPSTSFESLERPEYLIGKIAELAGKLTYAYTHLAGAELVAPYVVPNEIYMYIRGEEEGKWTELFEKNQIYPSNRGSIHLVVSDVNPFYGARTVRGIRVVSNFLLFADLYSCGGREREAAKFLAKQVGLKV